MSTGALVLGFVFGTVFGSFLNAAAWRIPQNVSLMVRSRCPACERTLTAAELIPVLSWVRQRGRCRGCKSHIPVRYPVVEIGTGLLWAATVARVGLNPELAGFLVGFTGLVLLSVIDLDTFRLPNRVLGPVTGTVVVLFTVAAVFDRWGNVVSALVSGVALTFFFGTVHVVYPKGLGFGDVKLAFLIGLLPGWYGYGPTIIALMSTFLSASLFGIAGRLSGKIAARQRIPYGPFLAVGAVTGSLAGTGLWDTYLRITGL